MAYINNTRYLPCVICQFKYFSMIQGELIRECIARHIPEGWNFENGLGFHVLSNFHTRPVLSLAVNEVDI